MAKNISYNIEARDALKRGVDQLANAVKVTLGPKGRNVIIDKKFGAPHITKDGVSVAKEIELADAAENLGAQLVKEVASKTGDQAGDGTTTATVLTQAIVSVGLKNVTAGANPMDLKRGMDKAVSAIVANITRCLCPPEISAIRLESTSRSKPKRLRLSYKSCMHNRTSRTPPTRNVCTIISFTSSFGNDSS